MVAFAHAKRLFIAVLCSGSAKKLHSPTIHMASLLVLFDAKVCQAELGFYANSQ
jgi:hypothetical protein